MSSICTFTYLEIGKILRAVEVKKLCFETMKIITKSSANPVRLPTCSCVGQTRSRGQSRSPNSIDTRQ